MRATHKSRNVLYVSLESVKKEAEHVLWSYSIAAQDPKGIRTSMRLPSAHFDVRSLHPPTQVRKHCYNRQIMVLFHPHMYSIVKSRDDPTALRSDVIK